MTVSVLWPFLTVLWVSLQCVTMVFPDHNHLLFSRLLNDHFFQMVLNSDLFRRI